ncbi:MAG: NAD(P)/FAD-dependent oxidoreductase [Nevskia sp.]|nr:NAD(P)/FAD-dependent oxidoreductase [Nevskia sp.]
MSAADDQPAGAGKPALEFDAVVIGAGFAGLYMLHRLRQMGLSARCYESGTGVGGTWYWNRYPGAACDVESVLYSYSFSKELEQEWNWSERYARQPEILRYANYVTDRFDLRKDIQFRTRVTSAAFDEASGRWQIRTDQGDRVSATYCVMATGCLSAPKNVDIPGLEKYQGHKYFTAYWPHEGVDFSGQRVGVIGTGSSGIQSIPVIAQQAKHLYVYQRTPNYSIPARNGPMTPEQQSKVKANYEEIRRRQYNDFIGLVGGIEPVPTNKNSALAATPEEREREYEYRWNLGGLYFYTSYADLFDNRQANETVAEFVRKKIREKVRDPAVAELLCPKDYPFGTKRLCADSGYYETFNRDNVTLVDIKSKPVETFTAKGLIVDGKEYELDSIVFATGFDAMTGALFNIDIRGRGGIALKDKWAAGPYTYLGLMTAGFPNMFITTGPGSPSVLYNMIIGNEQHVEWIADSIDYLRKRNRRTIEPTAEAEKSWVAHVNEVGEGTLFVKTNSWYVGANVPGKPRVILPYLGGFDVYCKKCKEVVENGYEGFVTA